VIRQLADGTRLSYEVHGAGDPPFVFVHGWCSSLRHWDAQIEHFAPRHRVLAVDRRGHGGSDAPDGGYTAAQHAADLAEVAGAEGVRAAVVVAHAGGGPTALAYARAYPELVRAVVLIDSIVSPATTIGDPASSGGAALGSMIDALEGNGGQAALETMYRGFFSAHAGAVGDATVADAMGTPIEVATAELRALAEDTVALARALHQPVLWLTVAGADEPALRAVFRDVQFGQVVESGHFPQLEVPDQVNAMIDRFVRTR
jgi:pimeloyl-ACP methyl ester carboxylesterase